MVYHLNFAVTSSALLGAGVIAGFCFLAVLLWQQKHLQGWRKWGGFVLWLIGVAFWLVGTAVIRPKYGTLHFQALMADISSQGDNRRLSLCGTGAAVWLVGVVLSWRWARPVPMSSQPTPEQEGVWPPPPKEAR